MSELPPSVAELVDRGVELWVENGGLYFLAPPDVPTSDIRSVLRPARDDLVSFLAGGKRLAPALLTERGPAGYDEGPNAVRSLTFDITGPLNDGALQAALTGLVARHEVLRTAYPRIGGGPVRLVHPPMPVPVPCFDGEEPRYPPRPTPFRPPLLTAALVRRSAEEHLLTLTVHGIAVDGMSLALLFEELGALYDDAAAGDPASLPEAPSSQAQVRRERAYLSSPEAAAARDYWAGRLASAPALRSRPGAPGKGGNSPLTVPERLANAVRDLASAQRTTPFAVQLAAYGLLLSEVTGCDDFTVCVPLANRWHPDDERTVSGARDLLLLRLAVGGTATDAIAVTHRERLTALAHGRLPFDALPADLAPPRRPGRNPVFGALFALQTFMDRVVPRLRGVTVTMRPLAIPPVNAGIDFGLMLWPQGGEFRGELSCDGVVVDVAELPAVGRRFLAILGELVDGGCTGPRAEVIRGELGADSAVTDSVLDEREGRVVAYVVLRGGADPAVVERVRRRLSVYHPAPLLVPVSRVPRDMEGGVDIAALRDVPVADPATLARWEAELGARAGTAVEVEVVPCAPSTGAGVLSPEAEPVAAQEITVTAPVHVLESVSLVDRFGTSVTPRAVEA